MSERGRKDKAGARAQVNSAPNNGASSVRRGVKRDPLMIFIALVVSVGVLYALGVGVGSFDEGERQRADREAHGELKARREGSARLSDDHKAPSAQGEPDVSEAEARREALQAHVREGMKARASELLELSPESALEKTARKPLGAKVSTLSPAPITSWRAGQALPVRAAEVPLAEGSGVARVSLSLSAQSAEGQRVALALRPKVRDSLHFLLSHRAPGALSLPEARERLERDLNERLARMSPQHELYVSVDELELSELEEREVEASP